MKRNIGFIGLGIMGTPMAKNILKAGFSLRVYDLFPEKIEGLVRCGAKGASSPLEVAENSDVIITMLQNSPHVKEVVFGEKGILEGLEAGKIWIDMSSISPIASREICESITPKGAVMLDAPVSGGEPKAIDGTLAIMVGGPETAFTQVEGLLKTMGTTVVHIGEIGSGNVTKLANQIMVAVHIAAMSEAMVLATKAGVDPQKVYEAVRGGLAGSTVLEAKAPKVLARDFQPGFRIELHIKDLMNALDTARDIGAHAPLTEEMLDMLKELDADGLGKEDHCSMVKYYESKSGVEVRMD